MQNNGENKCLGKTIIVGITYEDADGNIEKRIEFFGTIIQANSNGIQVRITNTDEIFSLPPDLNSIEVAHKGEYTFRTTGEKIIDPDYKTTWTVTKPKKEQ